MNTYRKYDKIYRIEMPDYPIKGKYYLAKKKEKLLFSGNKVTILEKVDGANTAICKVNNKIFLQKKGDAIDYSHPQYSFFKNEWLYNNLDKVDKLINNTVTYGELMRCIHTVEYNKLPDWWLVFDIFDLKTNNYWPWWQVKEVCNNAGLYTVPFIYEGNVKRKDLDKYMPEVSAYGKIAEGIVVKNYRQQVMGKYVKPEFLKAINDTEFWRNRKIELNEVIEYERE